MNTRNDKQIITPGRIENRIYFLHGLKVMLSSDLAVLYGVAARVLVQAVKRNRSRFPPDFMFQLTREDAGSLRSQTVISNKSGSRRGGTRYFPYAFTEQGVAMLSSVLRSQRAVQVNIAIMRAFLQLRTMLASHEDLRRKINEMEKRYDARFQSVFATLRQMLETPLPRKNQIGFHAAEVSRRVRR